MLMASEHFIPSKFVFSADYVPVVKNFPILAALAEACLWPVVLLLFDDQFVPRLSNLYRRRSVSDRAKPPQGKYQIIPVTFNIFFIFILIIEHNIIATVDALNR